MDNRAEKSVRNDPAVDEKAAALSRVYKVLHLLQGYRDKTNAQVFRFGAVTFDINNLISGVSLVARTRFRDMDDFGQRDLAWEIMEKINLES